jgi:hypothetical protein
MRKSITCNIPRRQFPSILPSTPSSRVAGYMNMNKLKQTFSIMSCLEHLGPGFMDANLFGVAKVEDGEGSTVNGEDCAHAEDVTVKVGCSFWITDTEADVVEFPPYCLGWLGRVCSRDGRCHVKKGGWIAKGKGIAGKRPRRRGEFIAAISAFGNRTTISQTWSKEPQLPNQKVASL